MSSPTSPVHNFQEDNAWRDMTEEYESLMPGAHSSIRNESTTESIEATKATEVNRMRRKLRFFFMNPIEKWQARRRFPYKFLLQVFKILLVTTQLCLFAHSRYNHVNYAWDNRISFSHLFLRGWTEEREVNAYPPNLGPFAIYNKDDFFDTLDYGVNRYASLSDAIGPYSYTNENNTMGTPELCLSNYKEGIIFGFNESYVFNSQIVTGVGTSLGVTGIFLCQSNGVHLFSFLVILSLGCDNLMGCRRNKFKHSLSSLLILQYFPSIKDSHRIELFLYVAPFENVLDCLVLKIPDSKKFSSRTFFKNHNITINFSALVKASLKFAVKTVNFKAAGPITPPDCYKFNIQILFDNEDMDGQMVLSLDAEPVRLVCQGDVEYINDNRLAYILRSILNVMVILVCATSLALCSRAIYNAQCLKFETIQFFREAYGRELSLEGRFEFWNLWYIMIIINDVLLILGSAMKEEIERKQFIGDQWNTCSLLLGTGTLLVWFGVLRYLGFFKTYNVVILTLKAAFPKVARFLLCAVLIYAGFTFCGWLVLGPYHMKFRSLASTSECLFALINGDDMYATFSMMSFKSSMLWWFSRIYLYSFISLYIYVVLSLFISVIMDAYDTIKLYYRDGFPKTDLQKFVAECREEPTSGVFRLLGEADSRSSLRQLVDRFCCCQLTMWYRLFGRHSYLKNESVSTDFSGCI